MMQSERLKIAQTGSQLHDFAVVMMIGKQVQVRNIPQANEVNEELTNSVDNVQLIIDDWICYETSRDFAIVLLTLRMRIQDAFLRHIEIFSKKAPSDYDLTPESLRQHDRELVHSVARWIVQETSTR